MFEIKSKIPDFERGRRSASGGLKFEPAVPPRGGRQISADFERGRFEIASHIALNIGKALWRMV